MGKLVKKTPKRSVKTQVTYKLDDEYITVP